MNNNIKEFYLEPFYGQKSFYKKALVVVSGKRAYLKSYDTIVCSIDNKGHFFRHWGGESRTTMKHINAFINLFCIEGGGVAWWRQQAVEPFNFVKFFWGEGAKV